MTQVYQSHKVVGGSYGVAEATVREALASPTGNRVLLAIAGTGGSGKSSLLGELETIYRRERIRTFRDHRDVRTDAGADAGRSVVLLDDAHLLADSEIDHVHALLNEGRTDLIVAYRPWPRFKALRNLLSAMKQSAPIIALRPWTSDDIDDFASSVLDHGLSAEQVHEILRSTGGMPWLVHRVVHALDTGGERPTGPLVSHRLLVEVAEELDDMSGLNPDVLLLMAIGSDFPEHAPSTTGQVGEDFYEAVKRVRSAGLVMPTGELVPLVQQALLTVTPSHRLTEIKRGVVDSFEPERPVPLNVAVTLASSGFQDPRVARVLIAAADAALTSQPGEAAVLYAQAVQAGSDELSLAARRAHAACAMGDLDTAGRLLEDLLVHRSAPDVHRGVDVSASIWAQRGMLSRGAEVYRWLGRDAVGSSAPLAAVVLAGAGDRDGARSMLEAAAPPASPTVLAVASNLMGEGIEDSLNDRPQQALAALVRASNLMTSAATCLPLPDLPAALGAIIALHSGESQVARSILDAALEGNQGGAEGRPRLLLLRAWISMQQGQLVESRSMMNEAIGSRSGSLAPRDLHLLHVLEAGIARRFGNAAEMVTAWNRAQESMSTVSVDLYSLLPLGELMSMAARLRESRWLEPYVQEAWALLEKLGSPLLWAVPLHWSAVQAALLDERPSSIAPHAAVLVRASSESHAASAYAVAGRAWISVLASNFDVAAVETAAHGLAAVGLPWDGSRLAGHAAARAGERKDMSQLLACARDLNPSTAALPDRAPASESLPSNTAGGQPRTASDGVTLSAREYEVATLVLQGRTYREIGETIYISTRTVEHHMARIRRRLGVTSRSELLIRLRQLLSEA